MAGRRERGLPIFAGGSMIERNTWRWPGPEASPPPIIFQPIETESSSSVSSSMNDSKPNKYLSIVAHYESCLDRHGDSHLGVDWPKQCDAETRYQVMLEVIRPTDNGPIALLDFGCGASHLYEYIIRNNIENL